MKSFPVSLKKITANIKTQKNTVTKLDWLNVTFLTDCNISKIYQIFSTPFGHQKLGTKYHLCVL